jgi:hypothetical protein
MKPRVIALLVMPLMGIAADLLFAMANNSGWFDKSWKVVEKPPVESYSLAAVDFFHLWVRSDTGAIYYNEKTLLNAGRIAGRKCRKFQTFQSSHPTSR